MDNLSLDITKASGEKVKFSLEKLRNSLQRTGADHQTINQIIDKVRDELYQGISTKEIYNRAFTLLKKRKSYFAACFSPKSPSIGSLYISPRYVLYAAIRNTAR